MAIFKIYNIDVDKPVPVVNLPPVRFIGGPTKQGITGNIRGDLYPYISVVVVADMCLLVKEALSDIGMDSCIVMIHLEFDCEEEWIK